MVANVGRFRRWRTAWLLGVFVVLTWAPSVLAHGGGVDSGLKCVHGGVGVHAGHMVHLEIFRDGKSYCEKVPSTGAMRLVFDLMSPELRRVPVRLRIDAIANDMQQAVAQTAPQVYPFGVAALDVNLDRPGRYVAYVEVLKESDRGGPVALDFPFVVGRVGGMGSMQDPETWLQVAPFPFLAMAAVGLWFVYKVWHRR